MTRKFTLLLLAAVFAFSVSALCQTAATDPALPAAPSATAAPDAPVAATGTGSKIGPINIEQAIFASNEGQRDFDVLSKKLEPKQTELKNQNDEVESLKKQLSTQDGKLNEDARATLVKQIEEKAEKTGALRPGCPRAMTPSRNRMRLPSASCKKWRRSS